MIGINWFEHQIGEYRPVPQTAEIFATFPSHYVSIWAAFFDQFLASALLLVCVSALADKRNKVRRKLHQTKFKAYFLGKCCFKTPVLWSLSGWIRSVSWQQCWIR